MVICGPGAQRASSTTQHAWAAQTQRFLLSLLDKQDFSVDLRNDAYFCVPPGFLFCFTGLGFKYCLGGVEFASGAAEAALGLVVWALGIRAG